MGQRQGPMAAKTVLVTGGTRIDVLINNVGGYWDTRHVTADGLEHTFALNHLAPFLLTNLLVDRLIQNGPARVVTVSSNAHVQGRIDSLRARATDAAGNVQPEVPPWNRLGYGNNAIEVSYVDVR